MTFDSIPSGTGFAFNAAYEENGIRAVSKSNNSQFGDPLNGAPTTALYFHGSNEYIEFSLASGGPFTLLDLELLSNGFVQRWIETSLSGGKINIGQPTVLTKIQFTGANFTEISWFRVGTPFQATEVDNINVSPGSLLPITAISPADNLAQVPINSVVTVAFGEAIVESSITTDSLKLVDKNQSPVSGTVAYNAQTFTATFTPTGGLVENNKYTVTLTPQIESVAGNRLPFNKTWTFSTPGFVTTISTDLTVGPADTQFEGHDLAIDGHTLTISGHHSFGRLFLVNGAVLTHPESTITATSSIDLELKSLDIDATSRIDVKGKGYLGARRGANGPFLFGRTLGNAQGSDVRSGGSHGGNAGGAFPNGLYGNFEDPLHPGSGGGTSGSPNNFFGDSGGGVVRITAEEARVDGRIIADGNAAQFSLAGAGSGGSIRLDVGTLTGSGSIAADGGNCPGDGGAGGGGRIAIYYGNATGFDLANVSARGGTNTPNVGGPGTIFLQDTNLPTGNLIIAGPAGTSTWQGSFAQPTTANLELRGPISLVATQMAVGSITLKNGSKLTSPDPLSNRVSSLEIKLDTLTIDPTSRLDVSGKGFLGARRGNSTSLAGLTVGFQPLVPSRNGGSHGGSGGGGNNIPEFGDFAEPLLPGSGGGSSGIPNNFPGDNGGGVLRISARTITVDGSIRADGTAAQFGLSGAGAGGGVWIEVQTLTGAGTITANGGNCPGQGGGGGGGRIAIYYDATHNFNWSNVLAQGGTNTPTPGAAGTVYLKAASDNRSLVLNQQTLGKLTHIHGVQPWYFTGVQNQQLRLQDLNASAPGISYSLFGPGGWVGYNKVVSQPDFVNLPASGVYTLLARSTGAPPIKNYSFRLQETVQTELAIGAVYTGALVGSGQAQLFRIRVTNGQPIRIVLNNSGIGNINELYASFNQLPTRGTFDRRFDQPSSPNQQIVIDQPYVGDWYVLLYGNAVPTPGNYTIQVIASDVLINRISPRLHGNTTPAVLTIEGAGFDRSTEFEVMDGSAARFSPTTLEIISANRMLATFNAGSLPPGLYSGRVNKEGTSDVLPSSFQILQGGTPKLEAQLIVPQTVGRNTVSGVVVEYANAGDAAMAAPILVLTGSLQAKLSMKPEFTVLDFWTCGQPRDASDVVQILASGQTPGLLQPGERVRVPVQYLGVPTSAGTSVEFTLGLAPTPQDVTDPSIDWAALKDSMRPSSIVPDAWNAIWQNFTAAAGNTVGSYQAMLRENASYLAQLGFGSFFSPSTSAASQSSVGPEHVGEMLAFEFAQADGLHTVQVLASSTDAFTPTPGLRLSFERVFPNRISSRYRMGAFGRGWSHNWEMRLEEDSNCDVTVIGPSGSRRNFKKDARGGWSTDPGDHGTLLQQVGLYQLREKEGLLRSFRSDGKLDYLEDPNGVRIACGYTADTLSSLTHSSAGQTLQIASNGGLIQSITDHIGRQTVYNYTGEHLTSVSYFNGAVITYTYSQSQGTAREHALVEIAYPGGTHKDFGYDPNGRLNSMTRDGGAEAVAFTFSSAGLVAATDALGHTTKTYLDHRSLATKVEDPLGNVVRMNYDHQFNLTSVADPAGHITTYVYDSKGNIVQSTDALGAKMFFTHNGPFQHLSKLTDAKANATQSSHDAKGNLTAITYANNTVERWGYDANGNSTSWINRRGNSIIYQYNANGQLTAKLYADGSKAIYGYDSRNNMIMASNYTGRIAMSYDDGDRLHRITYPGDRWLEYTYNDAGQRTLMLDQLGYRLSYDYDAVGRLRSINTTTGTRIVLYEYDSIGRLAKKSFGNGVYTSYRYDDAGQLLELTNSKSDGSVLSFCNYTYDARGCRTSMATHYGTWQYQYDAIGQLVSAILAAKDGPIQSREMRYHYDLLGSRTKTTEGGRESTYTVNSMNRYVEAGGTTYAYDPDGNRLSSTMGSLLNSYEFDDEDQLRKFVDLTDTFHFAYDAFGNRVTLTKNGITTTMLIHPFTGGVLCEFAADGRLLARWDFEGSILRSLREGGDYYYLHDGSGNNTELVSDGGIVIGSFAFEPFGELIGKTGVAPDRFLFAGEFGVIDENSSMSYMHARYFDKATGSFLSEDPLGIMGADAHLYRYANNNPISFVDPSGLGYFAKGPLIVDVNGKKVEISYVDNGYLDRHNIGTYHEQYFRDDGSNIGYGSDGKMFSLTPEEAKRYKRTSEYYDDRLMDQVLQRIGPNPGGYNGLFHNCQHMAEQMRNKYERLKPVEMCTPQDDPALMMCRSLGDSTVIFRRPSDPNELIGPAGFGLQNFLRPDTLLPYTINCENETNATAPAQRVMISNFVTNRLDWSLLELTEIAFGDHFISIPAGRQHFEKTVDVTQDGIVFQVQIETGIRPDTGEVYAIFQAIDPATSLPPPIDVGVLPPEDGTGRGRAHVSYVVRANRSLVSTGTEIRNIASITFDVEDVISTDWVDPHNPASGIDPNKQALVTIDAGGPASQVLPLPTISTELAFTVHWIGADDLNGSGISTYDVYVSDNGGPWILWQSATAEESAEFTGAQGHTYRFYSIARDNVGHTESAPEVADTETTVEVPNTAPVALNDNFDLFEDEPLTIPSPGILGNDTDADGNLLTAELVNHPGHGAVLLNPDGSFAYTPNPNFFGEDTFLYRANDGLDVSPVATVTLTVLPVNDPPVAVNDNYSLSEDAPLEVGTGLGVLSNDTDVDGPALMATLESDPLHGTLIFNADGSFLYTPHSNFSGEDSFVHRVSDGSKWSLGAVFITVNPVNDPPISVGDEYSVEEDSVLNIPAPGVLENDSDIEHDALVALLVSGPAHGTLSLNPNGSFSYTPEADYHGIDSFTYRASDGSLESALATATINVAAINDPPDAAVSSTEQTVEYSDAIAPITLTATDIDSEGNQLTVATSFRKDAGSSESGLPEGLTLVSASSSAEAIPGTAEWTLSGNMRGSVGEYEIEFALTDAENGVARTRITVTVTPEDAIVELIGPSEQTVTVPNSLQVVDAYVSRTFTGLRLNRTTGTFDATLTIRNTSPDVLISAPLRIVFTQISVANVTLANANGTTSAGHPYIQVSLANGTLSPGQIIANIPVKFSNPDRVSFTFSTFAEGALPNWSTITADLQLRARLTDSEDEEPGEIDTATITYYRDTAGDPSQILGTAHVPVVIATPLDATVGEATTAIPYVFSASEIQQRRADFVVYAVAGGNYRGASVAQVISIIANAGGGTLAGYSFREAVRIEAAFTEGRFVLRAFGHFSGSASLESSTDLLNWEEVTRIQDGTESPWIYDVPGEDLPSKQFYRMRMN